MIRNRPRFAKVDVAHVLRLEISAGGGRLERVQFGTCTDPYQPIEARYRRPGNCPSNRECAALRGVRPPARKAEFDTPFSARLA